MASTPLTGLPFANNHHRKQAGGYAGQLSTAFHLVERQAVVHRVTPTRFEKSGGRL
jgi:hypothetical protein